MVLSSCEFSPAHQGLLRDHHGTSRVPHLWHGIADRYNLEMQSRIAELTAPQQASVEAKVASAADIDEFITEEIQEHGRLVFFGGCLNPHDNCWESILPAELKTFKNDDILLWHSASPPCKDVSATNQHALAEAGPTHVHALCHVNNLAVTLPAVSYLEITPRWSAGVVHEHVCTTHHTWALDVKGSDVGDGIDRARLVVLSLRNGLGLAAELEDYLFLAGQRRVMDASIFWQQE